MKNVRIRVRENCSGSYWWVEICEGRKELFAYSLHNGYLCKSYAIKAAKAMAKRIGIKYDPEIIKMHGC